MNTLTMCNRILFLNFILLLSTINTNAVTTVFYYSKPTGNLNLTSTWGKNLDGSGASPSNFTTSSQIFNIRNNLSCTIGATWTVSGTSSNVILGDSISNIVFTVPSAFSFNGPIDISSHSKLVLQNVTVPTINVVGIPSVVEYASALTQTIWPVYYWDLICTSTGGRTWASGTTGILGTFSAGANAFTYGLSTVDFAGAQTQFVPAIKYDNIINSGGGNRILSPTGTIEIRGNLTPGVGTFTVTGSTVDYSNLGNLSFPVLFTGGGPNYNNILFTGKKDYYQGSPMIVGGDMTITSGNYFQNINTSTFTLTINGNLNLNGGNFYFSNGTGANELILRGNINHTNASGRFRISGTVLGRITFAGTGVQTITLTDSVKLESCFLTVESGAYVKLQQHLSLQRNTNSILRGTLNVLSGGTLDCSTFRVSADITNTGSAVFNLNSGATLISANPVGVFGLNGSISSLNTITTFNSAANYKFNSGSAQVPGLSNNTMNDLTIDNTANVTLQTDMNVNGVMTFINGKFNTTTHKITLGKDGSVTGTGAGKYVNGTFEKFILAGSTSKSFEIGEATSYDPVDLIFPPASNSTGSITAIVQTGDHPTMSGSGINPALSVNRHWTLTNNDVTNILPYNAEFTFVNPADFDPGSDPANFVVRNYTGSTWYAPSQGVQTSVKTGALSLSNFGDFEIGNHFPSATIVCPVVNPVYPVSGCSALVNFSGTASGNPTPVITYSPNPGTLFNVGVTPVTINATNVNGTSACTFNVTVLDTIKPVLINCPVDISASADFGSCQTFVFWNPPSASDNCSAVVISNHDSGSAFSVGTTTVRYTATDPSGNSNSCSFNVIVTDDEFPAINDCPSDIFVNTAGGCGIIVDWTAPNASDNCLFKFTNNHNPGDFFPIGTTNIIYSAIDSSHHETICTFNVVVTDLELPVITCPSDTALNKDLGVCGAIFNYTVNATDNCNVNVVSNPPSGSLFPVGTTLVSSVATDSSGNSANCSFNVTVTDNEKPVITCPSDIETETEPNACGATVNFSIGVSDNCNVTVISTHSSGSLFPVGTTNVVSIATDASGNSASCSFNIIVHNRFSYSVTSCDIYYFPGNGFTTSSGDFSFTYKAVAGCDSVVTAHVTINHVDDLTICTTDACNTLDGSVSHTPVNIDDGNACTTDACDPVTGPYHTLDPIADDNNLCTTDGCNKLTGVFHDPVNFDDNNVCTTDACNTLTGVSHILIDFNDNDSCTVDLCDPITGVSHDPVNRDDNNPCTQDGCDPGYGIFHFYLSVDDANPCTVDVCDPSTGTFSHTPINTDDNDVCTTDGCDSVTGEFHNSVSVNDANACTIDICDPFFGVFNIPVNTDDGDLCTTDACDPTTGNISHTPLNADDNNACTTDACNPLTGVSNTPVIFDDGDACTTDACNPFSGITHTPVNVDDGNACTLDGCDTDFGVFHVPSIIDDNDVCTDDACDPSTGIITHNPTNRDDNNACTTDACDPVTGVSHTPIDLDDNDVCTTDACDPITGVSHTPVSVDDSNPCTSDGCNSITGIFHNQICSVTLHSNIIIQGYYSGGGLMQNSGVGCLKITGVSSDPTDADTIFLSAMDAVTHAEVDRKYGILKTNGDVTVTFSPAVIPGTAYYIKINHRNALETWSASPVLFSNSTSYIFSSGSSQAFNGNMIKTPDNLEWAIYSGDIIDKGSIDALDFLILDPSIQNGDGGYAIGDITGDGAVDILDFLILDPNIQNGAGLAKP